LILEKIPLGPIKDIQSPSQLEDYVRPFIQGTPFSEWKEVLAHMIFSALKTPLKLEGGSFQLCQLNENQFYRETEFLYPSQEDLDIEELESKPGFVRGVIDLIFSHNKKYYLVDWKSNWLGENIESYSQDNLQGAMAENKYELQAELYKHAFMKYLKLVDSRPFEEIFGGIYYLFLRGLDMNAETGIYRIKTKVC
jgi:exodeoxyribonuclease V beta subunit